MPRVGWVNDPLAWIVLAAGLNVPDPITLIQSPGAVGPHIVPPLGEMAVSALAGSNE